MEVAGEREAERTEGVCIVSATNLRTCAHLDDDQHAVLGFLGKHPHSLSRVPFQALLLDYVVGLIAGAVLWGLTLGRAGGTGTSFVNDILHADRSVIAFAALGGVIFNVANLLLVGAIEVAGLAVAFPVGIGLALVVGALSSYIIAPGGNPLLLFGGIALVVAAIVCDALAYRLREQDHQAPEWWRFLMIASKNGFGTPSSGESPTVDPTNFSNPALGPRPALSSPSHLGPDWL